MVSYYNKTKIFVASLKLDIRISICQQIGVCICFIYNMFVLEWITKLIFFTLHSEKLFSRHMKKFCSKYELLILRERSSALLFVPYYGKEKFISQYLLSEKNSSFHIVVGNRIFYKNGLGNILTYIFKVFC